MNEQSSNEFFHGSSFMQGQNAEYLENLRLNFKENQNSVDSAWQAFFQSLESNLVNLRKARLDQAGRDRIGRNHRMMN